MSAGTALFSGWVGVLLAASGVGLVLTTVGDGWRFGLAVVQTLLGAAVAAAHFATRRRRLREHAGSG